MTIIKIFFKSLVLMFKLIPSLPLLFYKRHKGVKSFTQELSEAGIDEEAVKSLSAEYKGYSKILLDIWRNQKKGAEN